MEHQALLERIKALKKARPDNIAVQCFDVDYFEMLKPELQTRLFACIRSGVENPDSEMGCYAHHAQDYDDLEPFFAKALSVRHAVSLSARHRSSWELSETREPFNLDELGIEPVSIRIRVGRNLTNLPLPAAMTADQRMALEQKMMGVFDLLQERLEFKGDYHSLTLGHAHELDETDYHKLIDRHLIFKDMRKDPYLEAAGIADHWPLGRGCFKNNNEDFLIWLGEEDHLRLMVMETGYDIRAVFERLKSALSVIESLDGLSFARSERFGYITSCPTNLGTGMRASVHLKLPHLTKDGTNQKVKELAKPLGLAVRGLGGEHTAMGNDGTVDVSPSARFCITEAGILETLYNGIKVLVAAERESAAKN